MAGFYGFQPARTVERIAGNRLVKRRGAHSFDTVAALCATCVVLRPQEPTLSYYATPSPSYMPKNLNLREMAELGLMVMGSSESVGEIVLLKTIAAIMTEWGGGVARVRVNALGDRDSQQRFARELIVYLRKQSDGLDPECCERTAQNPMTLYACAHESCRAVLENGPRSVNFLSEKSRAHFRVMLEQLENLGLPYELDDFLVGDERDPNFSFAVDLEGQDSTVVAAVGGRFDEFFKRQTGRKESVGVAASIFFRKAGTTSSTFAAMPPARAPKVYFVQLGTRAKLQGLNVIDMLRHSRIPVCQSFDSTHLSPQLNAAKELGVSYMLIMGQREAIDGTIIVRETGNSSQQIVNLAQLPRFLKNLR